MSGSDPRVGLFTIAAWRPFADDLAAGLLARHADPLDLARMLVILPSRRAVRALSDAFVRQSAGKALLLPRMAPAGDLDEMAGDAFATGSFAETLEGPAAGRPDMPVLARQVALAAILSSARQLQSPEALALAAQLASALDTLEIEGRSAAELAEAAPEGALQAHWEVNARILETLYRAWPEVLEARGLLDPAARRNRMLDALAARWAASPPPHGVVMAGFASAPPAVARLARVVVRMPGSLLLLPGLDLALDEEVASHIREGLETHPQYGMLGLIHACGLALAEARPWPHVAPGHSGSPPARAALVSLAMHPPALSGARLAAPEAEALSGLRMVEAAHPAEEALVIALALRKLVEREGATGALVTPDRTLARRVVVQLRRFGIDIDDSAGEPLAATWPGSFLVALAAAAGEAFAPVRLLAALQHPLAMAGDGRLGWLNHVRALDRKALRGLRPAPGLAGVSARLASSGLASSELKAIAAWWEEEARPLLAPLEPLPGNATALMDCLRAVAERLAGPALWQGEAGAALSGLFDALEESRPDLSRLSVRPEDAAALVQGLMAGQSVRPRWRRHPQLSIWGPLEARLQTADLIVMGGLNEQVWPGVPAPDPFLAPAIRRVLGLPGLARRTGMQAHDFAMGLGAPEVLLTRSAREGGAPSVPSRFWQRLAAAAGGLPDEGRLSPRGRALLSAARELDRPERPVLIDRPAPAPPASQRPRRMSVTEVATLKADPFSFYARHMLKLRPLDPRDAEPTAGERGRVVHDILERWLKEGHSDIAALDGLVDAELAKLGDRPDLAALWRPRVMRMVRFVLDRLREDDIWTPLAWEESGVMEWRGVTLNGRADRIDSADEGLRIVDYKTGGVPGIADVKTLWQTQLALLAAMAEAGAFPGVPPGKVTDLLYLKLSGGQSPGEVRPALGKRARPADVEAHIAEAVADWRALAGSYLLGDRPFEAKLNMAQARNWGDYDLLARVAEWLGR